MSTEVSCGQVWCHGDVIVRVHIISAPLEWELFKKEFAYAVFCILTQLDSHRCSPNKDGHFKNVLRNAVMCWKEGTQAYKDMNMNPTDDDHPWCLPLLAY